MNLSGCTVCTSNSIDCSFPSGLSVTILVASVGYHYAIKSKVVSDVCVRMFHGIYPFATQTV